MRKRTVGLLLILVYLGVLLRMTVFRDGWYAHGLFSGTVVLLPFQTVFSYLNTGHPQQFYYQFFGNIAWFIPFGAYLRLCGLPAWKVVVLTAALSALIEVLQYVFGCGWSEVEDLLLNTVGGAIGCALAALFLKLKKN